MFVLNWWRDIVSVLYDARALSSYQLGHVRLAFSPSCCPSQRFSSIVTRSFLSSPFVFVGKRFKLTCNHIVGHGLRSAEQSPRCLQILLASL